MLQHKGFVRLQHMLDHSREALEMAAGKSREDLDRDRKLNLALIRLLEIVREAAGRTSDEERDRCASVPWSQIIALRNRLIHGYDSVDSDVLWRIIVDDLPQLIVQLEQGLQRG